MSLGDGFRKEASIRLSGVDSILANRYGGDSRGRQPVHTCYVPADRYHANAHQEWANQAVETISKFAPNASTFANAVGLPEFVVEQWWDRLTDKLEKEPIEDLRVDFEDGYGRRDDSEEDAHLDAVLDGMAANATPFIGARIKSLEAVTRDRSLKTLERLVGGLVQRGLPETFVITLPKVTFTEQVKVMVQACETLERSQQLPCGTLKFEIQIETTQSVIGPDGRVTAAEFIDAAEGRLTAFHYGTYDYSAAAGISAAFQTLDHPAADFAKSVLQVVTAQTGVRLSDGSTNIIPIGDRSAVHSAWKNHYRLVRRSLERGFYQGWDLHGAQLPTRYAAVFTFYRENAGIAAERLRAYLGRAETGTMDEPATAIALAGYFLRGLDAGAISGEEVDKLTGQNVKSLLALVQRKGQIA